MLTTNRETRGVLLRSLDFRNILSFHFLPEEGVDEFDVFRVLGEGIALEPDRVVGPNELSLQGLG